MMMKRFFVLLLSGLLLLSATACGEGKTPSGSGGDHGYGELNNGEPLELIVDLGGCLPSMNETPTAENPTVYRSTQYIADEFTKMYPNVTIKWEYAKGSFGDWAQWMTTQLAAGTAPDIAFLQGSTYADKGWYISLNDYLEQPNIYIEGNTRWKDTFPDYLWNNYMTSDAKGNIVAIPFVLYPGVATAYFYNKDIFDKVGVTPPKNWEEFIQVCEKINDAGYIAVGPWQQNKNVCVDNWDIQFSLGPSYAKTMQEKWDYNGDGSMSPDELLRATYEGHFYAKNNPAVLDLYGQVKRKYNDVLQEGAANTDYESLWTEGKVAMMEDGLWRMPIENSNTSRKFEYGLFPSPLIDTETSEYASEIEYTQGPYQPPIEMSYNVIKPTVEKKGSEEAAIRFLQWLTTPDNVTQAVLEKHGELIGAVEGSAVPPELTEWFKQEFPKAPKAQWVIGPTGESTDLMSRYLELWVSGHYTDEQFIAQYDKVLKQGITDQIEGLGIDTTGWTEG